MEHPPRSATWTPETIRRFWNYTSQKKSIEGEYFSFQVGDALVSLLQRVNAIKGGARVLDFGCGPGFLLEKFLRAGSFCCGFDFSDDSVTSVNQRFKNLKNWEGAVSSTTLPTPFDGALFDIVTCIETLEHLLDEMIPPTLGEIARLLKQDGIVLFTTPYTEDIEARSVYCPFCDNVFHPVQHVRSFDENTLRQLLEQHGFEVLMCRSMDLFELQRNKTSGRPGIKSLGRYWFNRIVDVVFPVRIDGTGYHAPRVSGGPNLCAIARKRNR
ncbi:class I SAM-dependent methyltransferase [Geobacter sp. SVR]|nr:class I SAM-dependent methyltransferase [Geobacter sp. SVR]BCS54868.1 hypothetical protein GSVR_31760 [Geobacter sp. SVR]GCF87386.1 hypothetical protein GSbR_39860 [Geobacter sp. SVR]